MGMDPAVSPPEAYWDTDVCSWTHHINIKEGIMISVKNAPVELQSISNGGIEHYKG